MKRGPYIRQVKRGWWLHERRLFIYMMREMTSLFIGFYCVLLAMGLISLARGQAAWVGFLAFLSHPLVVAAQLLCLAFAIFHSVTWFAVTPKAMPLMVRGEPVAPWRIIGAHYVALAVVSFVVLLAVR